LRVLYLHQYFNLPSQPGSTRSYEMARRLAAHGHQVHLVTSDRSAAAHRQAGWRQSVEAGIQVHWLPVPYSNHMSYGQRILAFFRFAIGSAARAAALPCDVVFATSTPLTIALPAVYAARRQRVPMVFEVRDLWPDLPIAMGALRNPVAIAAARWLERFAYRNASRVVALSPGMKEGVVKAGYPAERVRVIPNSADLELFDVPADLGRQFRRQHDWLQDRPLVVYTGTLGKINGVGYLARLAAAVRPIDPEAQFLIVGDGVEAPSVRQLAVELGVWNANFRIMNQLPKRDMPAVLSAADIATSVVIDLPALWANSANKFFDALAASTPMAINHLGWQADLLRETGAGLVLDPVDIEASAAALAGALRDPAWLRAAGRAAGELARRRFSRDALAAQLEEVLIDAARGGGYRG
jgi:glycosyltransferase involved in cell wall biosynthesis